MLTEEQLQTYERYASYGSGVMATQGSAIVKELVAEVRRLQAQVNAAQRQQQGNGKPVPSQDENRLAESRIRRINELWDRYGNNIDAWPHEARERYKVLDAEQMEYEREYC